MGDVFDQAAQADQAPTDVFDAAAKSPSGGIGQTNQNSQPDIAHQPASISGVIQTLGSKQGLQAAADPLVGFVKGMGDTVHGTGELIRKVGNFGSRNSANPGEGDRLIPPAGQEALDKVSTDSNGAQHVGKALENVAEYLTGEGAFDEAGKALSLGDRLKTLGSVGTFLEKHPFIAKMLASSAKGGVTAGTQTTLKTGSPAAGAEAGAAGAVLNPAADATLAGIGKIRDLYRPLTDVSKGTTDVATVQPVVQKGIRDVLTQTAADSGVAAPASASIRDVVQDTANNVKAKSQPIFQKLDDLSGGKLSDAQAEAKRYRGTIDKAGKDAYAKALDKQDALFEKYKDQFDPNAFKQAKADWTQYRALEQVNDAVTSSTVGQRPNIAASSTAKQPAETVNPKMLLKRLNGLYDDGTLQTALGQQGAHDLLQHAGGAQSMTESILDANKAIKSKNIQANDAQKSGRTNVNRVALGAAGLAGAGTVAGLGYHLGKGLSAGK